MKKVLAVLMAVLMFTGMFAMTGSAANEPVSWKGYEVQPGEVLILLHFGDCTSTVPIYLFNTDEMRTNLETATGTVAMKVAAGNDYTLPQVTAPSGQMFTGWNKVGTSESLGVGSQHTTEYDGGTIIQYQVMTAPAEAEQDTLETIKTILVKIFGMIVGLIYGDTNYGQELVANLFDSLLGGL